MPPRAANQTQHQPPHVDYYEGILQLRNPTKAVLEYVEQELEHRGDVHITKTVQQDRGVDLYLTSQRFLQNLGHKLQKQFVGELKISQRLHSRDKQSSRNIYRVTVLFSLTGCRVGDTITVRGRTIKIRRVGTKVEGIDCASGKRVSIPHSEISKERHH